MASRMPDRVQPNLDDAEMSEPQPLLGLLLAHDEALAEAVLADRTAHRARELSGLQVRDAMRRRTRATTAAVSASMRRVSPVPAVCQRPPVASRDDQCGR